MNQVIGSKPAICPPVLRDTLYSEADPGTVTPDGQSSDIDNESLNASGDKDYEDGQRDNRENADSKCDDDVKVVERKPLAPKKRSRD